MYQPGGGSGVGGEIPSLPVQVFREQKKLLQWSCSSWGGADCQVSHNATLAAPPSAIAAPPIPPAVCLMTRFNSCCQTWRRSQCWRGVLVTASVRPSTGSGCKNWCHSIRCYRGDSVASSGILRLLWELSFSPTFFLLHFNSSK